MARTTDIMANILQTLLGGASSSHQGLLVTQGAHQAAQQGPAGPRGPSKAAAMQSMSQMALLRVAAAEYPSAPLYSVPGDHKLIQRPEIATSSRRACNRSGH